MPLAALILACDDDDNNRNLPCILKVAGQTLFAHQVRMAKAAGAGHIVALVRQMPNELVLALDSLREDGISIDITRDAADAASRIHPQEQLLVMAEGLVADAATIARVATSDTPVLLCRTGNDGGPGFERIDGEAEWAGLALLDGSLLRDTASMVGDWVLGATLLRLAVQAGTERRFLTDANLVAFPATQKEADAAVRALSTSTERTDGPLVRRYMAKGEAALSRQILRYELPLDLLAFIPFAVLVAAVFLAGFGCAALGYCAFLLSPLLAHHVETVSRVGGVRQTPLLWFAHLRPWCFALILAASGWYASTLPADWGAIVLSIWVITGFWFQTVYRPDAALFPDVDGAAVALLLAHLAGYPEIGLGLVVCWLVFWQFLSHRHTAV